MRDVTQILIAAQRGDAGATDELFSVVYAELRQLAAHRMALENRAHTLQPTALVHEAWLRISNNQEVSWENRGHFFGAAAEAMRRILVDHARKKLSQKRGQRAQHEELTEEALVLQTDPENLLLVNEALEKLAAKDPAAAELVKLRYFVGFTMEEAASALNLSKRTAEGIWSYARSWLFKEISRSR
jgi:RNA polymerase sigma factor (TIGR02999 family)